MVESGGVNSPPWGGLGRDPLHGAPSDVLGNLEGERLAETLHAEIASSQHCGI